MSFSQTLQVFEAFDSAHASGQTVVDLLAPYAAHGVTVEVLKIEGKKGATDFVKICIPGDVGKRAGGAAPSLGIVGRLGASAPAPHG